MELWTIVFHSIFKFFHSIPFWHFPYSMPFHTIPCHFTPFHAIPCYFMLFHVIHKLSEDSLVRRPKIPPKQNDKASEILDVMWWRSQVDRINVLKISLLRCFWRLQVRVLMFNRFACFWRKGYQLRSLGKSHQNGDYIKQAMRKSCLPTEIEPAAFKLPIHCSTTWAREDVSSHA